MRRSRFIFLAAVLLAVAALSCQRRPLEYMYQPTVRTIVKIIWKVNVDADMDIRQKPTGVTLYFFRNDKYYNSFTTANVDSCEVQLEPGRYKMYMISQSPEEFWKMEFDHMTDYDAAETQLREAQVSWTRGLEDPTVENPEILYAGVAEEFEVTDQMMEDYQYYYTRLRRLQAAKSGDTKVGSGIDGDQTYYEEQVRYHTLTIPVYPRNVVSQLWITIYSGNADVLKSVRASTSGMARSFELTQDTQGTGKATQIMSEWRLTMDDPVRRVGHVDGIITTFGLPDGEYPTPQRDSSLNVSALLVDNATVANYKFEVGDKIQMLPPNPGYRALYRLIFGSVEEPAITPPDVRPPDQSSASGMDATVSDWDDGETVEIPM